MTDHEYDGAEKGKRRQHCTYCKNHGQCARKTNHKCQFETCECLLCKLTRLSRLIMRHQQRLWRHLKDTKRREEGEGGGGGGGEGGGGSGGGGGGAAGGVTTSTKQQKCDMCRNHGDLKSKRAHKNTCPYQNCTCALCSLTRKRRDIMRHQQRVRRSQVTTQQRDEAYDYVTQATAELAQLSMGSQQSASGRASTSPAVSSCVVVAASSSSASSSSSSSLGVSPAVHPISSSSSSSSATSLTSSSYNDAPTYTLAPSLTCPTSSSSSSSFSPSSYSSPITPSAHSSSCGPSKNAILPEPPPLEPLESPSPLNFGPEHRRNSWTVPSPHVKTSRLMDSSPQGLLDTKCPGLPEATNPLLMETKPRGLVDTTPPALLEAKTETPMEFQSPGFLDSKTPSSLGVLAPYDPASLRLDLGTTTAWRSLKRDRRDEEASGGAATFRGSNDLFRNLDFMRNHEPRPRLEVGRGDVGPHDAVGGMDYASCHVSASSPSAPAFRIPHVASPDFGLSLAAPQKKTRLASAHDCFPQQFTSRLWPPSPFQARAPTSHELHCYRRVGVASGDLAIATPPPLIPLPHHQQLLRPQPLTPLPPPGLPSAMDWDPVNLPYLAYSLLQSRGYTSTVPSATSFSLGRVAAFLHPSVP